MFYTSSEVKQRKLDAAGAVGNEQRRGMIKEVGVCWQRAVHRDNLAGNLFEDFEEEMLEMRF